MPLGARRAIYPNGTRTSDKRIQAQQATLDLNGNNGITKNMCTLASLHPNGIFVNVLRFTGITVLFLPASPTSSHIQRSGSLSRFSCFSHIVTPIKFLLLSINVLLNPGLFCTFPQFIHACLNTFNNTTYNEYNKKYFYST